MPGSGRAELYFVSAMMILILVLCTAAVVFFAKTYKKEMAEKRVRDEAKAAKKAAEAEAQRQDAAS